MIKFVGLLVLCFSSLSIAQPKNQFNQFFNGFDSLSANFEQSVYDDNNNLIASNQGEIQFKRPQQLIWHTQTPNDQILLLNNNELWLIDNELEQASLQHIVELKQTPLYWLLNRPNQLVKTPQYTYSENQIDWYTTDQVNQLRFGFQKDALKGLSLTNELGQIIHIDFSEAIINPSLSADIFTLDLGPDFDVIR
jgi:outer membrane lipoprotein carrier protein